MYVCEWEWAAAHQPSDSLSDSINWYHRWKDLLSDAVAPESMHRGGLHLGDAVQKYLAQRLI